jgi:hypothetical protein
VFEGWNCQFIVDTSFWGGVRRKRMGNCWDVWLGLPFVPLHLSWWYHDPGQ